MRGKNTLTTWIMAGIGAVFVLWLAVLIAPYAEGGLPGILLNMNEITAHPFRLEFCADTGKAVGIFLGGYVLVLLYIFGSQKNFRHGEEHGSAKWENVYLLNHRLHDKEHPDENRILSRHLSITTDQRKLDKNLFTLVIGGSGSRKTRAYVKPNLLQCNSSYIIMDPKGELLRDIGNVFKAEGYKIRVFDLIDMLSSFRYNPFIYFKRESDIQGFITNLFANTEDKTKHGGDAFWDKTAKMMLSALMYYVWYECPETEMNFGTVMELILAETVEEGDEAGISATQVLIEELRARSPRHIAVRYFDAYRKGAGETIMSIQESLLSRLEKFLLEDVVNLTTGDELELEKIGEEKTALFIRMPDDNSFHFLASALITQLFQLMMAQADARSTGSLPVPVHFVLEEARNITLPDSFQNWVATMRSRNITLSIILQNISQIKRMFPDDWESVSGMCDEILYLGGNEQSTHEWISKAMGQETIDNRSYGTTHSWTSGSNSTNEQNSGRALMDVTEVRLKNKLLKGKIGSVIMILADERPIIDEKYDLNRHPRIKFSADGGAPQYSYVSSALLPETNTIQINETDVDEDEVDGVFTFDLQKVELN
ncbi:MAG: VirD4-like conjugal transfer protein, CD1115 family [Hominenteromicrobium sp.]|uniref:VirD4-like conjugal transfer protein, CD1115 family n=1 Tax=Hominenteromicrobium sp. TaxID=3073581 RepID=UPI00399B2448